MLRIDLCNHFAEEEVFRVLLKMKVRDLDETKALEGWRQVADTEGSLGDFKFMAAHFIGVQNERARGQGRAKQEVAA